VEIDTVPKTAESLSRFRPEKVLAKRFDSQTVLAFDGLTGRKVILKTAKKNSSCGVALKKEIQLLHSLGDKDSRLVAAGAFDDKIFLARDYIEGHTLAAALENSAISLRESIHVAVGVLTFLERVHAANIIHRDLKPENIIVQDEQATVIDLGLAFESRVDSQDLLRGVYGSVRYMAPEQAGTLKHAVNANADLFSLGAILFECLVGQPLFDGKTVGEVLRQQIESPIAERIYKIANVPQALKQALNLLLQKDPRLRYATATAALIDFSEIANRLQKGEREFGLTQKQTKFVLSDPVFVGRQNELDELSEALEKAAVGRGGVAFLEAESGGGKSRLLEEFRPTHAWTLRGQGVDQSAGRPFQIFGSVIDAVVARATSDETFYNRIREQLTPFAQTIADAFPQMRPLFDLQVLQIAGPETLAEQRTLKALSELLHVLGEPGRPALLLLDDVQWADELSIKLLIYWASKPSDRKAHVLIVASFRSEEVGSEVALRGVRTIARIVLSPLGAQDVDDLIASMTGDLPFEAREFVLQLSQGNAFMACAIIQGLYENGSLKPVEGGWDVDMTAIREAQSSRRAAIFLTQRMQKFPPAVLRLLSVAAVLGKEFDITLLQELTNLSLTEAVSLLEEARSRRVIWSTGQGRTYSFTHDKIRETLLESLGAKERKKLHSEAADAIVKKDKREDKSRSFELAYHFSEAGEMTKAFPFALEAGKQARARHSLRLAETYFEIASQGLEFATTLEHIATLEGLGDVYLLLGKYDLARSQFEIVRKMCHEPILRAQIDSKIGEVYFKQGDVQASALALEMGLRGLGRNVPSSKLIFICGTLYEAVVQFFHSVFPRRSNLLPSPSQALALRLYSRLAYTYWFGSGLFACAWAHLREMNLAEGFSETQELAQAYSEHAPVMTQLPWFQRGIQYVQKSLDIRRRLGDLWGEGQSLHFYGVVLYSSSQFAETIEKCKTAFAIFERTGDRWEANTASWHIGFSYYRLGKLREAYEYARSTFESGRLIGDHQATGISISCWAKATSGRVPEELIEAELRQMVGDAHTRVEVLTAEALRLMHVSQFDSAIGRLSEAEKLIKEKGLRQEYVIPTRVWLVTALRRKFESLPPQAVAEKKQLLKFALKKSRTAMRLSYFYRNNLAHALREKAYLTAYAGRLSRAIKLLERSVQTARELKMEQEEALSLDALALFQKNDPLRAQAQNLLRAMEAPLLEALNSSAATEANSLSLQDRFSTVMLVGRQIASSLDHPSVIEAVKSGARQLLRVETCWVIENLNEPITDARVSQQLIDVALAKGEAVSIEDLLTQNPTDSLILLETSSALAAPIFVEGRAVACLCAVHRGFTSLFGEEEKQLAGFITALAGAALQNAGRVSEIQNLSEERAKLFQRAQKALEVRDQFLSLASHELKTPITTLQLQSTLLGRSKSLELPRSLQSFLPVFNRQLVRLGRLVEDLLDVSRLGSGRFALTSVQEVVDLSDLVSEIAEEQTPEMELANSKLVLNMETGVSVKGDRIRLGQVVNNLLSNARKYAPGEIQITVRTQEDLAVVEVSDQGPGIPEEYREKIFERFEQGPQIHSVGGLGLGLFISREIVRYHKGDLFLKPKSVGSCFAFALPRDN
jgi:signal transduction histidine kinase